VTSFTDYFTLVVIAPDLLVDSGLVKSLGWVGRAEKLVKLMEFKQKSFCVLDVGTSSVRCFIYNSKFEIVSTAVRTIDVVLPEHGYVEIEPEKLFNDVLSAIRDAVEKAKIDFSDIVLGISTQRSTFTTWSKSSGEVFHNLITWKDIRADDIVRSWNSSWTMRALNFGAGMIYSVTRLNRFLAGSVIKLMNNQVTPRLLWMLENNLKLSEAVRKEDALFGTLDSYLLYRLRRGKELRQVEHISDITNCTATGLFDPFTLKWASWAVAMFKFKLHMFPKVVDNSYEYGDIHESFFEAPVKIVGVMGDQPASMFGNCCFEKGDAKVTLGTGTFLDINTSNKCQASMLGLYPLVSWKLRCQSVCYSVEGSSADTATIINWGMSIGLFNDPSESSGMAESVESSQEVYFVPAFSGLSAPINDFRAASGFIGISVDSNKNHLTRALLESIVFRVAQLINASIKETDYKLKLLRIDGGVSRNDFICQTLADLCQLVVERSCDTENTSLGIAYLCAYNMKNSTFDELRSFYKSGKVFKPRSEMYEKLSSTMKRWEQAVERFKKWY
jgi:putative glycerol kinase 5